MPPERVSSKHPARRGKNEFYRYYAGYPVEFAEWALEKLALKKNAAVFDPWNGSGTTIAACAKLGFSGKGFDINPVMVHLGRARIASTEDFEEALIQVDSLRDEAKEWSKPNLRDVGAACRDRPVSTEASHSILITALFPRAAEFYQFEKSKNPTWYAGSKSRPKRIRDVDQFFQTWKALISRLQEWSIQAEDEGVVLSVERADSRRSFGRANVFDALLTSPPYLTRIDYVKATLPEFTLLSDFEQTPSVNRLRRSMLGSPLTAKGRILDLALFSGKVQEILSLIEAHPSKASSTYYYNFFATYFFDLQASLRRIARVLKSSGTACFVVQPSSYKEVLVDLPGLLVELAEKEGMIHKETIEFSVDRSMSLVNTKAHADARTPKNEYAVFFRRV